MDYPFLASILPVYGYGDANEARDKTRELLELCEKRLRQARP